MGSLGGSGGGFELNLKGLKRDELDSVLAMVAYPSRVCNNGPSLFLLSSIHQTVFPFSSFLSPKADFHCCFICGSVVQPQVLSWDFRGRVINAPQVSRTTTKKLLMDHTTFVLVPLITSEQGPQL